MRRLAIALLAVAALFATSVTLARAAGPTIYVTNTASDLSPAALADAIPAFQTALDQDFTPAWNTPATLVFTDTPPANAWTISVETTSDIPNAAGYHTTCAGDTPCAKVFTQEGVNWQLVFTHELWEMLVDPRIDRATYVPSYFGGTGVFYAMEVGDPVEAQQFSYTKTGPSGAPVVISDFVTERWFDAQGGGPLDFTGYAHHALRVLKGGYVSVWNGGWSQVEKVRGRRAGIFHAQPLGSSGGPQIS